jgi:NitT/TauT family transport system substrate-binding protein
MKKLLAILLALTLAPLAHAQKMTVAVGFAADFLPAFAGRDLGTFAKRGLDVTVQPFPNLGVIPPALISDSVQIGAVPVTSLLAAIEQGLDLVGVCGSSRSVKTNPSVALVTRAGSNINSPADLKGKRIGVAAFNGNIELFFRKWLVDNKVAVADVTRIEMGLPQMPDALKAGQVDAITTIEPFVTRTVASGVGQRAINYYGEVNPDVIAAFFAAKRSWADANRKAVLDFCAVYREGIDWALKNQEAAHQMEEKYFKFRLREFPSWNTRLEPSDLEFMQQVMLQFGVLRKPLDLNRVVWK